MKQFKKSFNKKILKIKILVRENFPNLYQFLCLIWKQKVKPIFWLTFNKPKGTLVYVGLNKGDSFATIHYKFKLAIGYEANPDLYKELVKKFRKQKHIKIFNFAASDKDSEAFFNISQNKDMVSSSLNDFSENHKKNVGHLKQIKIKTVNLANHLSRQNVNFIDQYISDAEGHDYTILKSLEKFITSNRIKKIQCEVTRNNMKNPYLNINNFEECFDKLLPSQYQKICSGWGNLIIGRFDDVPSDYNFMDVVWLNNMK
tara:strand:- start:92 stop:865 length:774 start_codon:yes stop_codon:yes gene_type:complete